MLTEVASGLFNSLMGVQQSYAELPDQPMVPRRAPLDVLRAATADLRRIVDTLEELRTDKPAMALTAGGDSNAAPKKGTEVAGVLSLDHMRAVYTAIEFLWQGVLRPEITSQLLFFKEENLMYPKTLVLKENTMASMINTPLLVDANERWTIYCVVFDVIFCTSFANTMQKRFTKRVLMYQLLTSNVSKERSDTCRELLWRTLSRTVDEECFRQFVLSIREIMHEASVAASGGGSYQWLLQDCGKLLSEYIMSDGGLKYVLQGYLDGTFADRNADIIQEKIAHTVTSVPRGVSKAEYYKKFCPQVMSLVLAGYDEKDNMLLQVCAKICNRLAAVSPILFKRTILFPILHPLLLVCVAGATQEGVVSNEAEVTRAVVLPLQLLASSPPSLPLLSLVQQSGYIMAILSLHAYLVTKAQSSGLISPCTTLCKLLLERDPAIPGAAVDLRRAMLFDTPRSFAPGGSGGVEVGEKQAANGSIEESLLGGLKSQLSAMQPESASNLTKESFEQLVALCMEEKELEGEIGSFENVSSENDVPERKRPNISRALTIAHSLELLSDCTKADKSTDPARPNPMSAGTAAMSRLLSDLFLQALSGYFAVSDDSPDEEYTEPPSVDKDMPDKEQCGAILLAMQSALPIPLLLADGIKIIQVLKVVLEAHAARLEATDAHAISSSPGPSPQPPSGRPLIEEISSSEGDLASSEEDSGNNDTTNSKVVKHIAEPGQRDSSTEEDSEFLSTTLSMLSTMLAYGAGERKEPEEKALRGLLPSLQRIASLELEGTVAEAATDVAVAIMTRGVTRKNSAAPFGQASADSTTSALKDGKGVCQDIPTLNVKSPQSLIDMCISISREFLRDEHPAMRALGVRHINTALKATKTTITIEEGEAVVDVLVNQLEDSDSFVYLSVIHTLRTLLDLNRKHIISALMRLFESEDAWKKYAHKEITMNPTTENILRRRVLLGESLMFGIKRAGELVPYYASDIISGCLSVIRTENTKMRPVDTNVVNWDMKKMTLAEEIPVEANEDLSAESKRSSKKSSMKKSEPDSSAEARNVDSVLLRQSALSLMAEVVASAGYGSSRYLEDIIRLASDVLAVEHSSANASVAMRRSASFMIKHIVTGLEQKLFFMKDSGSFLKTIYSRIKISCRDKDVIVRVHAESALYALNKYMKQQLFFGEQGGIDADVIPPLRILH